jgi:hypothetical protein
VNLVQASHGNPTVLVHLFEQHSFYGSEVVGIVGERHVISFLGDASFFPLMPEKPSPFLS